jgi:hypothetical protein
MDGSSRTLFDDGPTHQDWGYPGPTARELDGPVPDDITAIPTHVVDEPTAKIAIAMAETAKMVESAFTIAQAQGMGAMFDALIEDAVKQGEGDGVARAKRVMLDALERLKKGRGSYDSADSATKLYTTTPTPKGR